jgi:hypothetical protein
MVSTGEARLSESISCQCCLVTKLPDYSIPLAGFDKGQKAAEDALGIKRVPSKSDADAEENLLREVRGLKKVGTSKTCSMRSRRAQLRRST